MRLHFSKFSFGFSFLINPFTFETHPINCVRVSSLFQKVLHHFTAVGALSRSVMEQSASALHRDQTDSEREGTEGKRTANDVVVFVVVGLFSSAKSTVMQRDRIWATQRERERKKKEANRSKRAHKHTEREEDERTWKKRKQRRKRGKYAPYTSSRAVTLGATSSASNAASLLLATAFIAASSIRCQKESEKKK